MAKKQKSKKKFSLDDAAKDWDIDADLNTNPNQDTPLETKRSSDTVTFIEDPFQYSHDEILDAQNNDEPLDFEDLEDSDFVLENLEKNLKKTQKQEEESLQSALDNESNEELKKQIAEDLALQEEILSDASSNETENENLEEMTQEEAQSQQSLSEEELNAQELEACIESLIFISDKPINIAKMKGCLGEEFNQKAIKKALKSLKNRYASPQHGFELVEIDKGYQFRTKPGKAWVVKKLAKVLPQKLSRGAMETLAIISYRQPLLKEDIDEIRGVDSSHFLRGLLEKKLITISGRSELPGRPILYSTSAEFLEIFGLKDLDALPPLRELEKMVPQSETDIPDEDPKVRKIRELVIEMQKSEKLNYDPKEDEKILNEFKEKVKSIEITTPTLQAEEEAKKNPKSIADEDVENVNEQKQAELAGFSEEDVDLVNQENQETNTDTDSFLNSPNYEDIEIISNESSS